MLISEFLGNHDQIKALQEWIEQRNYPYAIIQGDSGFGKTTLAKLLAAYDNRVIQRVTPENQKELNKTIKSLNLQRLDNNLNLQNKLILIDDFDLFTKRNREKLLDIYNFCVFPLIYTATDITKLDGYFKSNALIVKLKRLLSSELEELLQAKLKELNLTMDAGKVRKVAQESKNVRSAINALYSGFTQTDYHPNINIYNIIKQLGTRSLTKDLDKGLIKAIFRYIRGYDEAACKVRERFADFDYVCRAQYIEPIDVFLVNNMIEPLEEVTIMLPKKKEQENQKEQGNQKEQENQKEKEAKPKSVGHVSLYDHIDY